MPVVPLPLVVTKCHRLRPTASHHSGDHLVKLSMSISCIEFSICSPITFNRIPILLSIPFRFSIIWLCWLLSAPSALTPYPLVLQIFLWSPQIWGSLTPPGVVKYVSPYLPKNPLLLSFMQQTFIYVSSKFSGDVGKPRSPPCVCREHPEVTCQHAGVYFLFSLH